MNRHARRPDRAALDLAWLVLHGWEPVAGSCPIALLDPMPAACEPTHCSLLEAVERQRRRSSLERTGATRRTVDFTHSHKDSAQ